MVSKQPSKFASAWEKVSGPPVVVAGLALLSAAVAVKKNEIWGWDWEKISYIATTLSFIPILGGVFAFLGQKKRELEAEEERNRLDKKENKLREDENRIRVEDNSLTLDEHFRTEQRWYADYKRNSNGAEHEHTERTHYSNLINIGEKAFALFIKPRDPSLASMKASWIDTIDEIVEDKNFIKVLIKNPNLLVGEDADFVKYFVKRMMELWPAENFSQYDSARIELMRRRVDPGTQDFVI